MRQTVGAALALAVLPLGAAPAAPPDYPAHYIHLDDLKALLDRGAGSTSSTSGPGRPTSTPTSRVPRWMPIASVTAQPPGTLR